MESKRLLTVAAAIAGVVFIVIAIVYFADTAKALPSFFPGHDANSTTHHAKHGVASLVVGLGCFVFAWFQSGPRTQAAG